jgi:hypothetical protein
VRSTNYEAPHYTTIPFLLLRSILLGTLFQTSSISVLCTHIHNMQYTVTSTPPITKLIRMLIRTLPLAGVLHLTSKTFFCFVKHISFCFTNTDNTKCPCSATGTLIRLLMFVLIGYSHNPNNSNIRCQVTVIPVCEGY